MGAAQRGKQVAVIVELKARFDEANNIIWARQLEDAGVHVAFGSASLKTHAKTALVVRRETDGIRRYVHLGSGNYNSRTARLYTDVGLLTCSPSIGADVSDLFNSLTGLSRQRLYRKLLVAPVNMRGRFMELIEREAAHARAGRPARIIGKMNALVDAEIIEALYAPRRPGSTIDLIVRGICCLRPGCAGVSDRIRVVSIIGRFLEHSRLWYFANGGEEEFYLGSADWMPRNFDRRVEAMAPVDDPALHVRLRSLLETYLEDNRQAWDLSADGTWNQREPNGAVRASHERLLHNSWSIGREPIALPDPAAQPVRTSRRLTAAGGGSHSISSLSMASEDSTLPSGDTISTGSPAIFASNADFRLAPHISSRMFARRSLPTGVSRIARCTQRTLMSATALTWPRSKPSATRSSADNRLIRLRSALSSAP